MTVDFSDTFPLVFSEGPVEVYYRRTPAANGVIVTFDTLFTHSRPPHVPQTRLIKQLGYSHLHIYCGLDIWYQTPEVAPAIASARAITEAYDEVIVYGSSMGGYGALLFSGRLGATRVVAMSPQFSVNPEKMPSEQRWRPQINQISFIDDDLVGQVSKTSTLFIVHDPYNTDDQLHNRAILKLNNAKPVLLPMAGHFSVQFLIQCGIMDQAFTALFIHEDPAVVIRTLRRRGRTKSPRYFDEMSKVLAERGAMKTALRAVARGYLTCEDPAAAVEQMINVLTRSDAVAFLPICHMLVRLLKYDHPEWTHWDGKLEEIWGYMQQDAVSRCAPRQ